MWDGQVFPWNGQIWQAEYVSPQKFPIEPDYATTPYRGSIELEDDPSYIMLLYWAAWAKTAMDRSPWVIWSADTYDEAFTELGDLQESKGDEFMFAVYRRLL